MLLDYEYSRNPLPASWARHINGPYFSPTLFNQGMHNTDDIKVSTDCKGPECLHVALINLR